MSKMNNAEIAAALRQVSQKSVDLVRNDSDETWRTLKGARHAYMTIRLDTKAVRLNCPESAAQKITAALDSLTSDDDNFGQLLYCVTNLRMQLREIADDLEKEVVEPIEE